MNSSNPDLLREQYNQVKNAGLSLDLTRGKPCPEQLNLSNQLLSTPAMEYRDDSGVDTRNYGGLDGLAGMKYLFSEIMDTPAANIIVGGNSSLTMMFEFLSRACLFGVPGGNGPWVNRSKRKFICPVPGYDRHFGITEHLGFELISVDMTGQGPDMDQVEALVTADQDILGIWCVPKYSNPTGACYSSETVSRLVSMKAAGDFRIMWDNAYAEHHISGSPEPLANIFQASHDCGNQDRVVQFASTSKMTFPGAGVSAMAASDSNISDALTHIGVQSIGPDKINQLRHLQMLPNLDAVRTHMKNHADVVKPKFDLVEQLLQSEFSETEGVNWSTPAGGYFVSLNIPDGQARKVVSLAADAGVALTKAGAPFPYGEDPRDRNIRIAPTFPTMDELETAMEVLCLCIKLVIHEFRGHGCE